jgi:hypothetical protein
VPRSGLSQCSYAQYFSAVGIGLFIVLASVPRFMYLPRLPSMRVMVFTMGRCGGGACGCGEEEKDGR